MALGACAFQATAESTPHAEQLRRLLFIARNLYRTQLRGKVCSAGEVQKGIVQFNRETSGLEYNDLYTYVVKKLRGHFLSSFKKRVRSIVNDENPSSTSSTSEEENISE